MPQEVGGVNFLPVTLVKDFNPPVITKKSFVEVGRLH